MKIIEKGIEREAITYRYKCPSCETIFEFLESEGSPFKKVGFLRGIYTVIQIDCPNCGERCEGEMKTLAKLLKELAVRDRLK